MSTWGDRRKIEHPDWVMDAAESLSSTVALYAQRRIPESIESAMIVTPVKRILRGVYGSDLRAALALLGMALRDSVTRLGATSREFWLFTILRKDREAYYAALLMELEGEEADADGGGER